MVTDLKRLYNASLIMLSNPLTPIGSPVTDENWPKNWPNFAMSPAHLSWAARVTLWHDILTYSDDHWSRQSALCLEWLLLTFQNLPVLFFYSLLITNFILQRLLSSNSQTISWKPFTPEKLQFSQLWIYLQPLIHWTILHLFIDFSILLIYHT